MKNILFSGLLAIGLLAGAGIPVARAQDLPMLKAGTDINDQASLQRGARLFFNYCIGCHSLKYLRYSRMAEDLGLSEHDVMSNLNLTGAKFGDPIISHMPEDLAAQFFGKAPPDLSLEVRTKPEGPDWVYSYLNSFYLDASRPTGWNNAVFPNASMPNPLWELQGLQTAVMGKKDGNAVVEQLQILQPGKVSAAQFAQDTRDLTAFLQYASEPAALQRGRYGMWVLGFLVIFTLLAYLLKKEYWKDVHAKGDGTSQDKGAA